MRGSSCPSRSGGRPSTRRLSKAGFAGASDVVGELYLADRSILPELYSELGIRVGPLFASGSILRVVCSAARRRRSAGYALGDLTELLEVLADHQQGRCPLTRRRGELLRAAGSDVAGGEHAGL